VGAPSPGAGLVTTLGYIGVSGAAIAGMAFLWLGVEPLFRRWRKRRRK
jgi:hypothetical protein